MFPIQVNIKQLYLTRAWRFPEITMEQTKRIKFQSQTQRIPLVSVNTSEGRHWIKCKLLLKPILQLEANSNTNNARCRGTAVKTNKSKHDWRLNVLRPEPLEQQMPTHETQRQTHKTVLAQTQRTANASARNLLSRAALMAADAKRNKMHDINKHATPQELLLEIGRKHEQQRMTQKRQHDSHRTQ